MFIGHGVHKQKPGPGQCPVNPCALAKRLKIFCCGQTGIDVELTVNRHQARVRYLGLDFAHL